MAVNVYLVFDPVQEAADGKGWKQTSWDDTVPAQVLSPTITFHATLTAAQVDQKTLFSADTSIDAYFQETSEATVLAANAAAVVTARNASMTAEGLFP